MQRKSYPSKVLLFGEYTVLFGGQALAIPYHRYAGKWVKTKIPSTYDLTVFFTYLKSINHALHATLNLSGVEKLIGSNMIFDSDIPPGIGLGSSGALSASIYDAYANSSSLSLEDKKADLALIESFFHGKSSGFDALISFENKCIAQSKKGLKIIANFPEPPIHIFLLYTGKQRDSQPLIERFQQECNSAPFRTQMEYLASFSSHAIEDFLLGRISTSRLKMISALQFNHLNFLIEPSLQNIWKESLQNPDFTLKICGAGGGGCYLVFSTKINIPQLIEKFALEKIDFKQLCNKIE